MDTPNRSRLDAIKERRNSIDKEVWQWNTPDQREVSPGFWLAHSCGPSHPAYNQPEKEEAWASAAREQAIINMLPSDIDYLLESYQLLIEAAQKVRDELPASRVWTEAEIALNDALKAISS